MYNVRSSEFFLLIILQESALFVVKSKLSGEATLFMLLYVVVFMIFWLCIREPYPRYGRYIF